MKIVTGYFCKYFGFVKQGQLPGTARPTGCIGEEVGFLTFSGGDFRCGHHYLVFFSENEQDSGLG